MHRSSLPPTWPTVPAEASFLVAEHVDQNPRDVRGQVFKQCPAFGVEKFELISSGGGSQDAQYLIGGVDDRLRDYCAVFLQVGALARLWPKATTRLQIVALPDQELLAIVGGAGHASADAPVGRRLVTELRDRDEQLRVILIGQVQCQSVVFGDVVGWDE